MLKILFIIIISLHGLIHLIGFSKAFFPAKVKGFRKDISRPQGILWLLATLVFGLSLWLYLVVNSGWWIWGLIAILLSQLLIITNWKEAKWGTLFNILLLIFCLSGYGSWQFDQKVAKETHSFLAQDQSKPIFVTDSLLQTLPPLVEKWLRECGVAHKPITTRAHIWQKGEMRIQPGGDWLEATSHQWFRIDPPGFIWNADVGRGTLMEFSGRDLFEKGHGHMLIKLYGIMGIVKAAGPKIDEGVAIRYLAEIIWFPSAALSQYIRWEEAGPNEIIAHFQYQDVKVKGHFFFNEEGKVIRFEALRYNQETRKKEPWIVTLDPSAYASFDGYKIPKKAEVSWQLKNQSFTWYILSVQKAVYTREPDR